MPLSLITGEAELVADVVEPDTPAARRQHVLTGVLDAIYGFAEHCEQELAGQLELAAAARREHDANHTDGFAVCANEVCRLAAEIIP